MAWESGKFGDVVVTTGDKPLDEFSLALSKIAGAYLDRFDRKPSIAELLYAFDLVLRSSPEEYVSDPLMIDFVRIAVEPNGSGK